jgi:hypothetical protein
VLLVDTLSVFSSGSQPYLGGSGSTYSRVNRGEANAYSGSGWCYIASNDRIIKKLDYTLVNHSVIAIDSVCPDRGCTLGS